MCTNSIEYVIYEQIVNMLRPEKHLNAHIFIVCVDFAEI